MSIIRRHKTENFTTVSNTCFRDATISARAKGIYAYIMTLPDDWKLYKSELVQHFSEGRDAINTAFQELQDRGYVRKEPIRTADGRLEGWNFDVDDEPTVPLANRPTENPSDGEAVTTKDLVLPKTDKTKRPPIAPQRVAVDEAFKKFYAAYPKHKKPLDAERAFKKAITKVDLDTMLAAIAVQKQTEAWKKDEGQYIPYPASWLNAGSWADDVKRTGYIPPTEYAT